MPRHAIVDADTGFAERLRHGVRYPLRGPAIITIVAVALFNVLSLVPGVGPLILILGWSAVYVYAFECLRHTADGFGDPPELAIDTDQGTATALIVIQLVGAALSVLAPFFLGFSGFFVSLAFGFVLPIITMSLAFDGVGAALNPFTWFAVIARLGSAYFVLVAIVLLTSLMQIGARHALAGTPLSVPLFYLVANYLTIFNFYLMGSLIHQHHEKLGYRPKADALVAETRRNADDDLLAHVDVVAATDPAAATDLLTERIRGGSAPPPVHTRYRVLLRQAGRLPELLVHGQIWIAALVAQNETRRALGVVKDCLDIEPAFLPDAPETAGPLADAAAHAGMPRIALHLATGYRTAWPRDFGALHYGLLAARMLERLGERGEAIALLDRLRVEAPDHPLQTDIAELARSLREQEARA
ncbi:hypothetical protein EC912_103266 [Luteibacter rhizovicinus]|uniref:Uncharacterized protein n=1 Tax=Luteibacter rhizovicinus TaxID=242606 RepID=A0A4R3YQU3_9GAMM|nr:DUF4013 domain-containing protein [Luteibacter rhizovicinus]TCV94781.1 hypothetical protein EC912_103266 [Luteibacter rhizovicinus]